MKNYTLILFLFATYLSNAQTWLTIDTVNSKYTKVFFLNDNVGFVSNYQGYKKTVDGGQTWTYVAHEVDAYSRGEIHFISADTGFRSGQKTHDGGSTWQAVSNFAGPFCFVENNQHAFAAPFMPFGNTFPSFHSRDYGEAWSIEGTVIPDPDAAGSGIFDIDFTDSLHGIIGSGAGSVFYTHDGAETWNLKQSINDITAVDMVTDSLAYFVAYNKLNKTSDGGSTWNHISTLFAPVVKIQFLDSLVGYYCNKYHFYKTVDGGINWTPDTSIRNVVDFHLVSSEKVYLLTWDSVLTNGGVFKEIL